MPAINIPHRPVARSPSPNMSNKPIILHIGDPIAYNTELYDRLDSQFHIINPSASDLKREAFLHHLKNKTWGDFVAIMRPFWNTGGEMKRWDKELIELLPESLKVYASAGAGYDWVDTKMLAEHGIVYCNSRGESTEAVADMALWHIISVFRNTTHSHLAARSLSRVQFEDAHQNLPQISHNPRDHTLGIVGLGDIGFAIAKKVKLALGMDILYNDIVRKSEATEREISAEFHPDRDDMLAKSDCVLIATPFAGERLVDESFISHIKPGARLVNIARGSLVDEEALADALEEKRLSAVGMDVHAKEPNVNERLVKSWNVTMTCHNGGGVLETIKGFERLAMENVDAVLNGKEPLTAVNAHLIASDKIIARGANHIGDRHGNMTNGKFADAEHADDYVKSQPLADGKMVNGHATTDRSEEDGHVDGTGKSGRNHNVGDGVRN